MAKPKQLSSAWWKKNKGMTVRDQGLEKALKEWEILTADQPILSRATYQKVSAAVDKIVDAAEKTIKKCNKTMHKESIGYCEDFILLAKKTGNKMKADQKEYLKKYLGFIQERKDVLKQFEQMKKAVEKIPNGNVDLFKTTGNPIRNPKVKISSYLHSDDIADGMDWLTKIFTVNKEILKRIKGKRS